MKEFASFEKKMCLKPEVFSWGLDQNLLELFQADEESADWLCLLYV
jgi:hypothetical protein